MATTMPTPVARLTEQDLAALREIKAKTAVIEEGLTGHRSNGKTLADVVRDGIALNLAEIARVWTAEHGRLLAAGEAAGPASAALAAAREQGFGPDSPAAVKVAKAVELYDAGATDDRIGALFGVSRSRVGRWREKAARESAEAARIAEALRLHRENVPDSVIAERVGVSRQQVGSWRRAAAVQGAGGEDRLGRARSRSKSAAPVRHATPVAAKFKAPAS